MLRGNLQRLLHLHNRLLPSRQRLPLNLPNPDNPIPKPLRSQLPEHLLHGEEHLGLRALQ